MDLEVQALTCPKVGLERGPQGARELLRKQIFDPRPSDFNNRLESQPGMNAPWDARSCLGPDWRRRVDGDFPFTSSLDPWSQHNKISSVK